MSYLFELDIGVLPEHFPDIHIIISYYIVPFYDEKIIIVGFTRCC